MHIAKKFVIVLSFCLCLLMGAYAQDVRLKILEQPLPELPLNYSTLDAQGTVILRVEFMDIGEIGEIAPVKELPAGLTERAIAAVRKIKFEPEKKEGKPVSVYRQLQYFYSWNGGWRLPQATTDIIAQPGAEPGRAEAIVAKAVQLMGGSSYLQVRSQVGRGRFSTFKENVIVSFQSFIDIIVYPDRERTEFRGSGSRTVQTNTGATGWVYDGDQDLIKVQNAGQVANFKQALRTSLDNLLRGHWRGEAELSYAGKRQASLGKRNDVVRLTYKDGFVVEFEFAADDGTPQKAVYHVRGGEEEDLREEDRYAQFIDVNGVKAAFIVDRCTDGKPSSRINYESIEYNRSIPESVFAKPTNTKDLKKDIRL